MDLELELFAEVADGPLVIEELPDGNSLSVVACVISCVVTHACATECLGTASTVTCGPCASSVIGH
ncbi:hypothetical protein [Longispora sp. NPDC051575]|uniref:hypothetical protein n=1 Tax=Longispora sp. NPDC051575 TaxID=3154943 RepID=UPI003437295F